MNNETKPDEVLERVWLIPTRWGRLIVDKEPESGIEYTRARVRAPVDREVAERIAANLFHNGAGQRAGRLLLVQESRCGDARVTDASYLGGFSETAVADIILAEMAAAQPQSEGDKR